MASINTHIKTTKMKKEKMKKAFLPKLNAHKKVWVNGAKKG